MRALLSIMILVHFSSFGQDWRDTLQMARDAYKKGEYEKALGHYERIQKTKPSSVDLSDEMGQTAYKAREFGRAEKIYQQGSANKKSTAEKSRNYHNIGNSRLKNKDYDGAIEAYKESLRNDPNNEETRYNLSEAIRRKIVEEKKQQQNQNNNQDQNQNQDQNNQQNQNQNQQNQQDQNQQDQNQQDQNQNQQNKGQGEQNDQNSQATLPNQAAEKMLDDLMKKEAETKRRMSGGGNGKSNPISGKDW